MPYKKKKLDAEKKELKINNYIMKGIIICRKSIPQGPSVRNGAVQRTKKGTRNTPVSLEDICLVLQQIGHAKGSCSSIPGGRFIKPSRSL